MTPIQNSLLECLWDTGEQTSIQLAQTLQVGTTTMTGKIERLRPMQRSKSRVDLLSTADILMKLIQKGVVTNLNKKDKLGKSVFTQMVGMQELKDWAEHNLGPLQAVFIVSSEHKNRQRRGYWLLLIFVPCYWQFF